VVLHARDDHLVALLQACAPPAGGDQVDPLRRPAREQNALLVGRVDERSHLAAGLLVGVGGDLAEVVDAAVDVGVLLLVVAAHRVNDLPRLLRRGAVVEIN
jgi:hypothetical protein